MTIKLGVVMDAISSVAVKKDSTLAMLWEAEHRDYEIFYFQLSDLFLRNGKAYGMARLLHLEKDPKQWYHLSEARLMPLSELQVILMRKDPPFNETYIYSTYILEQAENEGVFVVNRPQSLRDANEKLFTMYFPQCCPETLVTQSVSALHEFWLEHQDIVCKPLDSMGGTSVFRLPAHDVNANVIFENLTEKGKCYVMAQKFIPAIKDGDKRIILINGEPIPYVLARVPQEGDWRGNLVVGAKGEVRPLTEKDQWICDQVGPMLRAKGLYFVGIDIIGEYLTEVNVTSPTGIRELESGQKDVNISAKLMNFVESQLKM